MTRRLIRSLRYETIEVREPRRRLDSFISDVIEGITRSQAKILIESSKVRVDGAVVVKPSRPLAIGEIVRVRIPCPEPSEMLPESLDLDIVHEDGDILVLNKPRGLVVHPAPGHMHGTLANALLAHCADIKEVGDPLRPGIVHRLDKDTSGLIAVAKTQDAYISLTSQLKARKTTREYTAIAEGAWARTKRVPGHQMGIDETGQIAGTIGSLIGRHPRDRKRIAVLGAISGEEKPRGKEAITIYAVVKEYEAHSLVRCSLLTGRTHQIRVHMAYIGHPLVGDRVYSRGTQRFSILGQALHASKLCFVHPRTVESVEFEAPLPSDMEEILKDLAASQRD